MLPPTFYLLINILCLFYEKIFPRHSGSRCEGSVAGVLEQAMAEVKLEVQAAEVKAEPEAASCRAPAASFVAELRELHARAMLVPSGADKSLSTRLAGFTREKVVDNHPSVLELRKELEAAAQKQAQAKQDTS